MTDIDGGTTSGARPRRATNLTLNSLRIQYENVVSAITHLLSEDPIGLDDNSLVNLSQKSKSLFKELSSISDWLFEKCLKNACIAEANDVRQTKLELRTAIKQFITVINTQLSKFNVDQVSNLDTASLHSTSDKNPLADLEKDDHSCSPAAAAALSSTQVNLASLDIGRPDSAIQPVSEFLDITSSCHNFKLPIQQSNAQPSLEIHSSLYQRNLSTNPPYYSFPNSQVVTSLCSGPSINITDKQVRFSDSNFEQGNLLNSLPHSSSQYHQGPTLPSFNPTPSTSIDNASNYMIKQEMLKTSDNPFTGEPSCYNSWKLMLVNRMKGLKLDPIDQICILAANTSGEPHKLIKNFTSIMSNPKDTLDTIWASLEKKFGSSIQICHALKKKLEAFPMVKPPNINGKLTDLLQLCRLINCNTSNNNELLIFNLASGQQLVWTKFPDFLQQAWRSFGHNFSLHNGGNVPPFTHLVGFLESKVDELCDPNYEKPPNQLQMSISNKPRVNVFKTESDLAAQNCMYHNCAGHNIIDCKAFMKLSYQDKRNFAKEQRLCYLCLSDHLQSSCDSNVTCQICSRNHLTIMHRHMQNYAGSSGRNELDGPTHAVNMTDADNFNRERLNENTPMCSSICNELNNFKSCSKVILVDVYSPSNSSHVIRCYTIIDEQSNRSFITNKLADLLDVSGPEQHYYLSTVGLYKRKIRTQLISNLKIRGVGKETSFDLPSLYKNGTIPDSKHEVATPKIVKAHPHIAHLAQNFHDLDQQADVLLLIGRDGGNLLKTECIGDRAPFVHNTPLGYCLVGEVCPIARTTTHVKVLKLNHEHFNVKPCFSDKAESPPLRHCFEEHPDDDLPGLSKDDQQFMDIMREGTYINRQGNLTMPLPFKSSPVYLPLNKNAVFLRTKNTLNRLKRDESVLNPCIQSMKKNLDAGHVEEVPLLELKPKESGKAWWLPVFAVKHPKKLKPRLVFDSSASFQGVSLNSQLLQGPDNNNRLRGVLFRFREGKVAFNCDIEAMFYNFYLPESDKDYLRFFWFANNDPEKHLVEYRGCVHLFGNKPSPSIAQFGLDCIINSETRDIPSISKKFIQHNFYVDDGLGSSPSANEAIKTLDGAIHLLRKFNIRLHKISSNCPEVIKYFPKSERAEQSNIMNIGECSSDHVQSTLGIKWNLVCDELSVNFNLSATPFTRRGLVSAINSIYDPLGIANPIILKGKVILRQVMHMTKQLNEGKCNWDDPLPDSFANNWKEWKSSLCAIQNVKLPRCYCPATFGDVKHRELHAFCDSSEYAIGTVIYQKLIDSNNTTHVSYTISRSKLLPKAATSMPRSELCAAYDCVDLCIELLSELHCHFDAIYMYTDSKVVLGYLNNTERRFAHYVTRRVNFILKFRPASNWCYIPTEINPADVFSRPHGSEIISKSLWIRGPEFLHEQTFHVPFMYTPLTEPLPELQEDIKVLSMSASNCTTLSDLIDRCSTWRKLLSTTCSIISCARKTVDKAKQNLHIPLAPRNTDVLPTEARNLLVSHAQQTSFPETFELLSNGSNLPSNHHLIKLDLFLDDNNIMRIGGRLSYSDLLYCQKYPILLPRCHHITILIVRHYHMLSKHQGRHITHGALRQAGYHIERGTKAIRKVISDCITCQRLRAKPQQQLMASLPPCRLEQTPPFTYTGLDVFGPFHITDGKSTRQTTGSKKLWVLILVCMASRAIHLEPLNGLDVSSFKNALHRFIAVRGTCRHLFSDQGTNFVASSKQESTAFIDDVSKDLQINECQWHFNPPHASHWGGSWERKIGAVRRVFEASVMQGTKSRLLTRDEFVTLMCEAMSIVNNTPLWDASSEGIDPAPVSPAMLLTLKEHPNPPSADVFCAEDIAAYGKQRWRRAQFVAECFWRQWRQHYLLTLQERNKWQKRSMNLQVGDLVLVKDKSVKRNMWPTGVIENVKLSRDNFVRSVSVMLNTKDCSSKKVYQRPISEVILIAPHKS